MNMDMVNPIPPKNPTPTMDPHVKSLGILLNPRLEARKQKRNIPIGLPKLRPVKIPKL